jgi:hypothetical protein
MTPPTRRVDRGRGHVYFLDAERAAGVTWIIDNGVPKPQLVGWAANVTADYATDNWEDLAELKPSERNAVLRRSRWEVTNAAAKRGSEVHDHARRYLAGEEIEPPEELVGHVDASILFHREWQPRELLVEAVVGNRLYGYMGTLDLVAGLADGRVWLLDWKTGGKGIYPEFALQLAAYRRAEFYLDALGNEHAMPKVDAAGCVWLRGDGSYDLVPLETGDDVFATFLHALQVARFTSAPAEAHVGNALTPPEGVAA